MRWALCWKRRDSHGKRGYEGGARAGSCLRRNDGGSGVGDRSTHDQRRGSFSRGGALPPTPYLLSPLRGGRDGLRWGKRLVVGGEGGAAG